MRTNLVPARCPSAALAAALSLLPSGRLAALDRTWIGGNVDWLDGGSSANWSPADEPDTDDTAIFSTSNTVNLGSSNAVAGLTMSGGISLATRDFDLTVDGLMQLTGSGTDITIGGSASVVQVDSGTAGSGGRVILDGGFLTVIEEAGEGSLVLNAGGSLTGQGTVNFNDALPAAGSVLVNYGTISASSVGFFIGSPPAGTLVLNAADTTDARLDLDAFSPVNSVVNVFRNQTLDINIPLNDAYSGDVNLFQESTLDLSAPWSIDSGATIDVDNGFIDNGSPLLNVPAGVAHIAGAGFTQSAGTITVIDNDGTLQFDAPFTQNGGSFVNNGLLVFNANSTINSGADLTMPTANSSLTVNPGVSVGIHQGNFNADGGGYTTNVLTLGSGALLELWLDAGADELIGGTVALNGGELYVNTLDNDWGINGHLQVGAGTTGSRLSGEAVTLSGPVSVGNGSTLLVDPASTLASTCTLTVGTGSTVTLSTATTVNGPSSLAGAGTLRFGSSSTIAANTTVSTGIFDWDGVGVGSPHTIADGVVFTIASPQLDGDGNMADPLAIGGNGASLLVNGPASWDMTGDLTTNTIASGTTILGGNSEVRFLGNTNTINGNTTIEAPVRFGSGSDTVVGAAATLSAVDAAGYELCTISGTGWFNPTTAAGGGNHVTGNTAISTTSFNFDAGSWTVDAGVTLEVLVGDYDPDVATNAFDSSITLQGGGIYATVADPSLVMDGLLTMSGVDGGVQASWGGDPLQVGNDAGTLDADLVVAGDGVSRIDSAVTFMSDADVEIGADATLVLSSTANFNPMGTGIAQFTGAGRLATSGSVFFNEETTVGMTGGSIDLDCTDLFGSTVHVHAPVTLQAADMVPFGKVNVLGTNVLEVDSLTAGTNGSLRVELDTPSDLWLLNSPGILNLNNDAGSATLLSGSPIGLNGTVNVTGDVRSDARLEIGGTVNILSGANAFRLSGGDAGSDYNTIEGGVINGPGRLGADNTTALVGYGTIHADVDFDAVAYLLADMGTLTVDGDLLDVWYVGTHGTTGVLNMVNAWSSGVAYSVQMQGGQLTGGTISVDNAAGVRGHGWVRSRVINNTQLHATSGSQPLRIETALNDNDWDGVGGTGVLHAGVGADLECHDNAQTVFTGTVDADVGGKVYASGFAFDFNPGSTIDLEAGHYLATMNTYIGGTVNVTGGGPSSIGTEGASVLRLESGSTTTLGNVLNLVTINGNIQAGATFAGTGTLAIPSGSAVSADNGADINVLVDNGGALLIASSGVGRIDAKDYQQSSGGVLRINLEGTGLSQFDRLVVDGGAQLSGDLALYLGGGYVPAVGDTLNVISATGGVTGSFDPLVQPAGMPSGVAFKVNYTASLVQLEVVSASTYDDWINSFAALTDPADRAKSANPDGDELDNFGEFALDGDPTSGASGGKIVGKVAPVGGVDVLTLTFPVRTGSLPAAGDPAGGPLVLDQTTDGVRYRVEAGDDLATFALDVTEVLGADAMAIQAGMPGLGASWVYRTFRSPGPVAGDPREFIRVEVDETP